MHNLIKRPFKFNKTVQIVIRIFIIVLILFPLVGIINLLVIQNLNINKIEKTSGILFRQQKEYIFPNHLASEEDSLIQYFQPQYSNLSEIKIRLAFNHSGLLEEYGAKISLTLKDSEENILKTEIISNEAIPNWSYYNFKINEPLSAHQTYSLTLKQLDAPLNDNPVCNLPIKENFSYKKNFFVVQNFSAQQINPNTSENLVGISYFFPNFQEKSSFSIKNTFEKKDLYTKNLLFQRPFIYMRDFTILQNLSDLEDFPSFLKRQELLFYKNIFSPKFALSYVPFVYWHEEAKEAPVENISCKYNNQFQDYSWDLYYTYHCIDKHPIYWLIFTNLFILLVLGGLTILFHFYKNPKVTLIFTILSPIIILLLVETITGNLFTIQPFYLFINLMLYSIFLFLVILFFQKIQVSLYLTYILFPVLSLLEYYVYKLRGRSFMLQDIRSFQTAKTVMKAYNYDIELTIAIPLLVTIALIYIIMLLPSVSFPQHSKTRKTSVIILVFGLTILLSNRSIAKYINFLSLSMWDIETNYQTNGYFLTLLSEIQYLKQTAPDGYSENAVSQIAESYLSSYKLTEELDSSYVTPENIILIMNESWADFRYIADFPKADTITPFIDSLHKNVIKGYLHVPVFGAGTANSEYEVLTGNCMQFLEASNIAYQLYIQENEWGLASTLKEQGFQTVALHPNTATNWNRNIVYPRMKFDKFISYENWPKEMLQNIRWCTSDESSYNTLIKLYKEKEENEKLFSFLVTMQNHGGYNWSDYPSTVSLDYETKYPLTEQYLSLIQESDHAFASLVEAFENIEDPTMIIMFGDHLPNIENSFYENLLNTSWENISLFEKQKIYTTPFVIWTNYNIPEQKEIEMSSNYFGSYILQLTGMELTDYNKCLLEFMKEIPIIGTGMVMDKHNNWYNLYKLPDNLSTILNHYQIIQYNNIFGGKKKQNSIFSLCNTG